MYLSEYHLKEMGFKSIGKNVLVSTMASIYNPSKISIGDNSRIDDFCILSAGYGGIEIGRYVHIACYTSMIGKALIRMNDYSGLSSRVSVFSSSDKYDGEYMTNPCLPANVLNTYHEAVILGKHVVVGAGSVILPGVVLADGCAVGAMSLVNKSFQGDSIVSGIPAVYRKDRKGNIYELEKLIDGS